MFIKVVNAIINSNTLERVTIQYEHEDDREIEGIVWLDAGNVSCPIGMAVRGERYMLRLILERFYQCLRRGKDFTVTYLDAPISADELLLLNGEDREKAEQDLIERGELPDKNLSIGERYNKEHNNASTNSSH